MRTTLNQNIFGMNLNLLLTERYAVQMVLTLYKTGDRVEQ